MKKKKSIVPAEYIIAFAIAAAIIAAVVFAMRSDEKKRENVDGTYSCEFPVNGSDTKSVTVYYKFDAKEGRYEELWGERSLMTGSYEARDDTVTLTSDGNENLGAESETETFFVLNDMLIPQNYIYEGTIPSGQTFDAECTMTDSGGQVYEVRFAKDGSYTYVVKGISGEENSSLKGTYEREGDFLHRTNADGGVMTDFYVYDGKLAGIIYTKE